jgi:LysR family nitrogen assimilation transcriptional regulator
MPSILDPKWQLFVKVAELGSITKAAVTQDVPQSMVSRHIAQLERECGARLFRRTGRGVVLTEFGELIFPRIQALIDASNQLVDDIQSSGGQPMGEVRIGLLPSTVPLLAGKVFGAVHERFPQVQLHLTEGSSAQLEEWLGDGRLDMSFLLREADTFQGVEPVVMRLPLHLVGAAADPLTQRKTVYFQELEGLPLILPSSPHLLRARLDRMALDRGMTLRVSVEADSIRLQHEIAAAGGGYAITVGPSRANSLPGLSAARLVRPQLERAIVLGTTVHRAHTLATREVHQLVLRMARTLLGN